MGNAQTKTFFFAGGVLFGRLAQVCLLIVLDSSYGWKHVTSEWYTYATPPWVLVYTTPYIYICICCRQRMAEGIGEVVNVNVGGILYTTTLATLTKVISIFLYLYFYISIFWFLYFFSLISMFLYLISISINILYILYKFILYKYPLYLTKGEFYIIWISIFIIIEIFIFILTLICLW